MVDTKFVSEPLKRISPLCSSPAQNGGFRGCVTAPISERHLAVDGTGIDQGAKTLLAELLHGDVTAVDDPFERDVDYLGMVFERYIFKPAMSPCPRC